MNPRMRQFVKVITAHQSRLYSYILSLVADPDAAEDVLQETNVVIWEKVEQAMTVGNFTAWAYGVARMQVLAYLRDRGRDRHVFDPELIGMLADRGVAVVDEVAEQRARLERCLGRLDETDRGMLEQRYRGGVNMQQIADQIGKSVSATKQSLYRVRLSLLECVRRIAAKEESR